MKKEDNNKKMEKEWADRKELQILNIHTVVVGSGAAGLNSADCL